MSLFHPGPSPHIPIELSVLEPNSIHYNHNISNVKPAITISTSSLRILVSVSIKNLDFKKTKQVLQVNCIYKSDYDDVSTFIKTLSSMKTNSVLQSNTIHASGSDTICIFGCHDNDMKLVEGAKIKTNGRYFDFLLVTNKFIEIFKFGKDCYCIQIDTIKNSRKKIIIRSIVYARLATKFLSNGFWRKSRWTEKLFTKMLKLFWSIKLTLTNRKNRDILAFQTIAKNWGLLVVEKIKKKFKKIRVWSV